MSQEHLGSGNNFHEALISYDPSLAEGSLGTLMGASLKNTSGTSANIIVSAIGIIVGAVTGTGFFRTTEADTGEALLAEDGVHFFNTSAERVKEDGVKVRKHVITGHSFVDYANMRKSVVGRSIIFTKQLSIFGIAQDGNGRDVGYRLSLPFANNTAALDTLKHKLETQGIRTRKSRTGKFVGVTVLALFAVILFALFRNPAPQNGDVADTPDIVIIAQEVFGESDTYISENFHLTFVDAFFTTRGAGQRQTDVIAIFFDYEALVTHSTGRPFNRFTVYQGDVELARLDSGIRESLADGRAFLTNQDLEAGEVFRGMVPMDAYNLDDPIILVVYGPGDNIIFQYQLVVR